jgi:hypothetical protein
MQRVYQKSTTSPLSASWRTGVLTAEAGQALLQKEEKFNVLIIRHLGLLKKSKSINRKGRKGLTLSSQRT